MQLLLKFENQSSICNRLLHILTSRPLVLLTIQQQLLSMFCLISRQFNGYIEHNSTAASSHDPLTIGHVMSKFLGAFVTKTPGKTQNLIRFHSLSKPGRSIIMHCGILFKIPYCYISTLLVSSLLMQSLFVLLPHNNKTTRSRMTRRSGIYLMHHNNGIKCFL